MKPKEAIKILELHNQWRRGAEIPMESPENIGLAIDSVLAEMKRLHSKQLSEQILSVTTVQKLIKEFKKEELTYEYLPGSEDEKVSAGFGNLIKWMKKKQTNIL